MNLGFFGVQFSFGLTQTAVNPLFTLIGANPHELPILNIAGPITGLIIQPLIGAISDKTWSDGGAAASRSSWPARSCASSCCSCSRSSACSGWPCSACGCSTSATTPRWSPTGRFISDRLPKIQIARGFLTQSMFTGAGAVLANLSLFILQKVIGGNRARRAVLDVLVLLARRGRASWSRSGRHDPHKEIPPTDEKLAEIEAAPKGLGAAVKDIAEAVKDMPVGMHKIGVAFLFQWYAMFIYWQFVAVSIGETVFNAAPETRGTWRRSVGAGW